MGTEKKGGIIMGDFSPINFIYLSGLLVGIIILVCHCINKNKKGNSTQSSAPKPVEQPQSKPTDTNILLDTHSKVAGVTKDNPDGRNRQDILKTCKTREKLTFVREPNNPYSKNAVAIYRGADMLGYVNEDFAATIAPMIDSGAVVTGNISSITGGGKYPLGCNYHIKITKQ